MDLMIIKDCVPSLKRLNGSDKHVSPTLFQIGSYLLRLRAAVFPSRPLPKMDSDLDLPLVPPN